MKRKLTWVLALLSVSLVSQAQVRISLSNSMNRKGKLIIQNINQSVVIKGIPNISQVSIYGLRVYLSNATAKELVNGSQSISISDIGGKDQIISIDTLKREELNLRINTLDDVIKVEESSNQQTDFMNSDSKGIYLTTYYVEVPAWFSLSAKLESRQEKLQIENLDGEVDIENKAASTILKNVAGPIAINSDFGDVSVQNFDNHCRGPMYITTGTSNIQVFVPEDMDANVRVMASKITVDPDITWIMENSSGKAGNWFRSTLNKGGTPIHLQTGIGEVTFRLR